MQTLKQMAGIAPLPWGIDLLLTDECNLRCRYCPIGADVRRPAAIVDSRKAIRFLESVAHFRPMIRMFGGEPFLHPEWPEIFAAAASRSLPFTVVTNATRLAGRAEELVRSGLCGIGISVDPPEQNDLQRGRGTFENSRAVVAEIVRARKKLGSTTPVIEIYTTVHEGTYALLSSWADHLAEWHVDTLRLQHQIWIREQQRPPSEQLLMNAVGDAEFFRSEVYAYCTGAMPAFDLDVLGEQLRRLQATTYPFRIEFHPPLPVNEMLEFYSDPDFRRRTARACTLTSTYTFVDPTGRLFPCFSLDMGNVFEQPFEQVWNGPKFRAFRRLLRREGRLPFCERCPS